MSGLFEDELEPRQGKALPNPRGPVNESLKSHIRNIISGNPEVMVKLMPGTSTDANGRVKITSPRDKEGLRGLVTYITSDSGETTDEQGNVFSGEHIMDSIEGWSGMPESNGKRREVFHVILSMPRNTPEDRVANAVVQFCANQFQGHQYLIAHHNHQNQPHAHVALKVRSIDGMRRLNPDRNDLQNWRENFAEALWSQGIDAAATSRLERLSTRENLTNAEYRAAKKQGDDVLESKLRGTLTDKHIAKAKEHLRTAAMLDQGGDDDRKLASALRGFVDNQISGRQLGSQAAR